MGLRLLSYNIERGGVGREAAIAAVIRREHPDLVILQEATRPDVVVRLAEATGMTSSGAHLGRSLGFLSRLPLTASRWRRPRWSQHAFLELSPADLDLRIVGVHVSAVHAAWTEARRVRELRALLAAIADSVPAPHIVVGDFNTLAPDERLDVSRLPRRLRLLVWLSGGRIRWQTIAIMLGAGYVDGFRQLHPQEPGYTFPIWDPHVRLDYAFVPKSLAAALSECVVVDHANAAPRASDHFPLRVDLDLPAREI
jgi:endonuclease/exonuclease/phosphatase family metal-dependent hydrolase